MPLLFVLLLSLNLLGLVVLANRVDKRPSTRRGSALIYSLSLASLCSSWTFFGATGLAVRDGWAYLPNFLGPILALTLFYPVWRRLALATKHENIGSIADLLSSRYGKSRAVGILAAITSIVGAVPFMALQLVALSKAWAAISGSDTESRFAAPIIVGALGVFAIMMGARSPVLTHHNRGLVRAVAVESLIKLLAIVSVAALAVYLLINNRPEPFVRETLNSFGHLPRIDLNFMTSTLLCLVTGITLPRQFHLAFVELRDESDLAKARWILPVYMLTWSVAIPFIAIAVKAQMPANTDSDLAVLSLAQTYGGSGLTALAYLGGFSAGAAMVMMEAIALSAMISNELILPAATGLGWMPARKSRDVARTIVTVRRGSIIGVLVLAYLYFLSLGPATVLGHLGFISVAASAQLVPSLVGAVFWRRGHAAGTIWGILAGMFLWFTLIVTPEYLGSGISPALLRELNDRVGFEAGVLLSLGINTLTYVALSLLAKPKLTDRIQAMTFVNLDAPVVSASQTPLFGTLGDMRTLLEQFLGPEDGHRAFDALNLAHRSRDLNVETVDPGTARAVERMLAGAIGTSSARSVISLTLAQAGRNQADIAEILDEAAQAIHFSRELLHATLESLDQGVCVVDRELRLTAWNSRFVSLFDLSPSTVFIGQSFDTIVRDAAARDGKTPGEIERIVRDRIDPILRRENQMHERDGTRGMTLKVVGAPIANGDYAISFTDVTELKSAVRALAQANDQLEQRVAVRTTELRTANAQLADAKARAERMTNSQVRFVAAASHDLLQPLHAARLFLAALLEDLAAMPEAVDLVAKADLSIDAANRMLRALLNLSRLEVGGVDPEFTAVDMCGLLDTMRGEFEPVASERGLRLRILTKNTWVCSNPDLLRSVLQNLIGNAVRYTPPGGAILVGCRYSGKELKVEVRDNGPGIPEDALQAIFKEYSRLDHGALAGAGTGLGLAIADRICRALGHSLHVRSEVGKGSVFSVRLARVQPRPSSKISGMVPPGRESLRVLCVDDDPAVLESMTGLMRRWGMQVTPASSAAQACAIEGEWDVILADYHLGEEMSGLDLLRRLAGRTERRAVITAEPSETTVAMSHRIGVDLIRKPVSPSSLRAYLSRPRQFLAGT